MNLLYIDDEFDNDLSSFLEKYSKDQQLSYSQLEFNNGEQSYEDLLKDKRVQKANIIIVDSHLFEQRNSGAKFTGEEFRLILKKLFSFIETIVISRQKDASTKSGIVDKYNSNVHTTFGGARDYYNEHLKPKLDEAKKTIEIFENVYEKMQSNTAIDSTLQEKIHNALDNLNEYDEFTKKDIDNLIKEFIEIKRLIQGSLDE